MSGNCESCGTYSDDLCVCYRCKRAVCPSCSVLYLEDPSYRCMREPECEEAR